MRALEAGPAPPGCLRPHAAGDAAPPTLAVSALGGVAASVQAMWALKFLLGRGAEVAGNEVYFDLDRGHMSLHALRANPRCLLDHHAYPLAPLGRGPAALTVAQTFDFAEGRLPGGGEVGLHLQSRALVTRLRCVACGVAKGVARLAGRLSPTEDRCACGGEMRPGAMDILDRFDRGQAAGWLDRTWEEIGVPPEDVVVAARGERELALLLGGGEC